MNELAVKNDFQMMALDGAEMLAAMREELGPNYQPDFARAGIPAGGVTMFSIKRGADDDDPEMVKYLDGVIVYQHDTNAYWPESYGGGKEQPICQSRDGVTGHWQDGQVFSCATCQYNQFGSETTQDGTKGRGKACKNGKRVYILRDGELFPTVLSLPPTAIKAFNSYIFNLLMPKGGGAGMRPYQVVTRIELKQLKNATGIAYAAPTFKALGTLPVEKMDAMAGYAASIKAGAQGFTPAPDAEEAF